jgi:hypothetical protein
MTTTRTIPNSAEMEQEHRQHLVKTLANEIRNCGITDTIEQVKLLCAVIEKLQESE